MAISVQRATALRQWEERLSTMTGVREESERLPLIGHGGSRVVFDLGDGMVLKTPYPSAKRKTRRTRIGCACNIRESITWQRLSSLHAECTMFAQVYACAADGSWLIAEALKPHELGYPRFNERLRYFLGAFNRYYGSALDGGKSRYLAWVLDMHIGNFGVREADDRLVLLDLDTVGIHLKGGPPLVFV